MLGEAGFTLIMAVSPPAAGATQPADGSEGRYYADTVVNIRAIPGPGYIFDHWQTSAGDAPIVDPVCATDATVVMDADKTVTAVFVTGATIDSEWIGGTACPGFPGFECWNSAENWCPQVVPDNVTENGFNVDIWTGAATLNISPTLDDLTLGGRRPSQ